MQIDRFTKLPQNKSGRNNADRNLKSRQEEKKMIEHLFFFRRDSIKKRQKESSFSLSLMADFEAA